MFAPLSDDDVPAVVALMNRAYRGAETHTSWSTEEAYLSGERTTVELLRADLRNTPEAALLKWVEPPDTRITGCVWLEPLGGDLWYLGSLAADPERQNRGLGRVLLTAAEAWVRAQGGRRVQISVINVRDALIGWYHRRGYRPTGKIEPFPYGDNRFGTPLRDDLAFVVLDKPLDGANAAPG